MNLFPYLIRLIAGHLFIALGVIFGGLTVLGAWGQRSVKRWLVAAVVAFFGVMLPLFIFFFSAFLSPESKASAHHGWIDCFYQGKLALTPFVLWATAALFLRENQWIQPDRRLITFGLLNGAMIAAVCCVFGVAVTIKEPIGMKLFLLVPFYTAVWNGVRAIQGMGRSRPDYMAHAVAIGGSVPFWIGSLAWARWIYASLPDNPPDCFVVTAATRGHEAFVGPFVEVMHRGRTRRANRQLATLWELESRWSAGAPKSHAVFRGLYNRVGPVIAARIRSPWLADAAFVALKPVEMAAGLFNRRFPERMNRPEDRPVKPPKS